MDKKTLRVVLDKVKTLVADPEKRVIAMNLLSAGFNQYNGAYLAFVAWENDPYLSQVTMATSWETILRALGEAAQAVDPTNPFTLLRVRAIFAWFSDSPVELEKAKRMIQATQPSLLKDLV